MPENKPRSNHDIDRLAASSDIAMNPSHSSLFFSSKKHKYVYALDFIPRHNKKLKGIDSLTPGKFEWNVTQVILKLIFVIDGWGISCEIALKWLLLDLIDDKSTLFQVMAWCHQAPSHYLKQCWPSFVMPYGVIRPQWVKSTLQQEKKHISHWYIRNISLMFKLLIACLHLEGTMSPMNMVLTQISL